MRPCQLIAFAALFSVGCGGTVLPPKQSEPIVIDGDTISYPLGEHLASAFGDSFHGVNVSMRISGESALEEYMAGNVDVLQLARQLSSDEIEAMRKADVPCVQHTLAVESVAIVTNRGNTWATHLTLAQVASAFFDSPTHATSWRDLDPRWPDENIRAYGVADSSAGDALLAKISPTLSFRKDLHGIEDD